MIKRILQDRLQQRLFKGKAIILMGARQVGKTTLLKELVKDRPRSLWYNADEAETQALFKTPSSARFRSIIGNNDLLVIDEAQRIKNIGLKLKLITDELKHVQLIATGSSAFELANEVNEPLTGRKWEYQLHPLSFGEMAAHHGLMDELKLLPDRLVFGYYPDVVVHSDQAEEVLKLTASSYLFKDILSWNKVKKPDRLMTLLQALAFQVGNQVSYRELGQMTNMDNQTVESYISLLEQSYVVFRLPSFSRNLRNELKASRKIYFYDNGVRNAVISNFGPVELRNDVGALWENFLISERMKLLDNAGIDFNRYFWRTRTQQEIDYIEERNGQLSAFEFKWNPGARVKYPKTFTDTYPDASVRTVTPSNFEEFLMP